MYAAATAAHHATYSCSHGRSMQSSSPAAWRSQGTASCAPHQQAARWVVAAAAAALLPKAVGPHLADVMCVIT